MSSQTFTTPSGPARESTRSRRADTFVKLMAAGREELREVGHDALTIRGVAARAGVSPATAYTYLASKNHLFAELFLAYLDDADLEPNGDDALERVTGLTSRMADLLAAEPALSAAVTPALLSSDPDVERLRLRIGGVFVDAFAAALADASTPDLVDTLTLAFSGALLQAGMGVVTYADMATQLERVVATILKGHP